MKVIDVKKLFSLIELLIVISILAVLMSLFMPALRKSMYQAQFAQCTNGVRTITTGLLIYADDNNEFYPHRGAVRNGILALKKIVSSILFQSSNPTMVVFSMY
jgi:prepilin-type N-terminal cleavage/methylation domain-containing protein